MKKFCVVLLAIAILFNSAFVYAKTNPLENLLTPAEESNWARTTSSQEVIDFCLEVTKQSEERIKMEYIARTAKGRLIPLLVISNPAPEKPTDVSSDKTVVLVNCNIHSGEVEGKEAMLIFAREVALGMHDDLLKDLVILLVPNMNPDGNDDLGKNRISSQFTPKLVGTRTTGEGYNVNRDMTKLDSIEGRAVVSLMNKWDPVIFIDAHATNGSFMRHAISYNWGLHPNTDSDLMEYNRGEFSDLALGSKSYLREKGKISIPYGNFGKNYSGIVSEGWVTFEDYPRYTTNYAGLRNRLAMLLECYSYDPFPVRVDTQYECIYGTLLAIQQEKDTIKELIAQADERSINRATVGIDPEKDIVALDSDLEILEKVTVMSYNHDDEGRIIATRLQDEEGDYCAVEFEGEKDYELDYYGKFVPKGTEVMGAYYLVEADGLAGVELLMRHGVKVSKLIKDTTISADKFQWYDVEKVNKATKPYEGHLMNKLEGTWKTPETPQVFPIGTYVISSAQPLGAFAALMLEPASVDGATSWNFFDSAMQIKAGAVREKYSSNPTDSDTPIGIPIFKVSDFDAIPSENLAAVNKVSDVTLSGLTISSGTLLPKFKPDVYEYTAEVAHNVDSVKFVPTAGDAAGAAIRINNIPITSGTESDDIDLTVGSNTVTILVTGADGSSQAYTINVKRDERNTSMSFIDVRSDDWFYIQPVL